MKKFPAILLILIASTFAATAQNTQPVISDSLHSQILNETRELRIILPKEFQAGSKYEVLYICDGEWYQELVPFTYGFAESSGYLPKSIFVLIRNRYLNGRNLRDRDFSPTPVPYDSLSGGADNFYNFVTTEVVPYIEKKYTASGQRSLLGSSFSGLFSVYAFLKDPAFFQSFIASDPNINFGDNYITGLAAKKLPQLTPQAGTLYIAGLTSTYRDMGIFGLDSVLQASAPKSLRWQCVAYEKETHYSVQLKAFYDGLRFSHFGFGNNMPELHPSGGMVAAGKSFMVYPLNNNPSVRFTIDGSEPTLAAPLLKRDSTFVITSPARVRLKSFANRAAYVKEWTTAYDAGQLNATKNNKKLQALRYRVYEGAWNSFPDVTSVKVAQTGIADSTFKLNKILPQQSAYIILEGQMDFPRDAEYIFFVNGSNDIECRVGDKILFDKKGDRQSFIISLAKGKYPFQLKMLHKNTDIEPHLQLYSSSGASDRWWENRVFDY